MIQIIVAIIIILSAVGYYFGIFRTKSLIKYYNQQFEKYGLRVFNYDFTPFKYAQSQAWFKAAQKSKDDLSIAKQVTCQFDVAITNLVHNVQINLISPKLMQAYYENDQDKYYKKSQFFVGGLRRAFGNGITFTTGNRWKQKRKILTKMLNFTYIKELVPKIQSIIQKKTQEYFKLTKKQANQNKYVQIDLLQVITTIASTVVLQLFFGGSGFNVNQMKIDGIQLNHFFRHLFELLLNQLLSPLTLILGQRFTKLGIRKNDRDLNRAIRQFRKFCRSFIEKRLDELKTAYQKGKEVPEVYTDLIEAFYCEEIIKEGHQISDGFVEDLIDDFGNLYVAGTDTTSHNSQVALYYITKHPQVLAKIKKQIAENIKDLRKITYEDMKTLIYLQATITESLRIYSTANGIFPREAIEDHYLKLDKDHSILVKKGTIINTQTFSIHYKQTVFEKPYEFRPERFITSDNKIHSPEPYTWMNFSAGSRSCVGKQLALTEIKLMIITLVSLYDLKLDDSDKVFKFKEFAYKISNVKFEAKRLLLKNP